MFLGVVYVKLAWALGQTTDLGQAEAELNKWRTAEKSDFYLSVYLF